MLCCLECVICLLLVVVAVEWCGGGDGSSTSRGSGSRGSNSSSSIRGNVFRLILKVLAGCFLARSGEATAASVSQSVSQ